MPHLPIRSRNESEEGVLNIDISFTSKVDKICLRGGRSGDKTACQLGLTENHSPIKPLKFMMMASCDRTSAETKYVIIDFKFKYVVVRKEDVFLDPPLFWTNYEFPPIKVSNRKLR